MISAIAAILILGADPWAAVPAPPNAWSVLPNFPPAAVSSFQAHLGPSPVANEIAAKDASATAAGALATSEARAIDRRAIDRYGWKLCLGSCGMVCASHGGGLKWLLLKPGEKPDRGEVSEKTRTAAPPVSPQANARGRVWISTGLFGRRGYWQEQPVSPGPQPATTKPAGQVKPARLPQAACGPVCSSGHT